MSFLDSDHAFSSPKPAPKSPRRYAHFRYTYASRRSSMKSSSIVHSSPRQSDIGSRSPSHAHPTVSAFVPDVEIEMASYVGLPLVSGRPQHQPQPLYLVPSVPLWPAYIGAPIPRSSSSSKFVGASDAIAATHAAVHSPSPTQSLHDVHDDVEAGALLVAAGLSGTISTEQKGVPAKRGRGRPRGSKNKLRQSAPLTGENTMTDEGYATAVGKTGFETPQENVSIKRGPGRPRGSKNKPQQTVPSTKGHTADASTSISHISSTAHVTPGITNEHDTREKEDGEHEIISEAIAASAPTDVPAIKRKRGRPPGLRNLPPRIAPLESFLDDVPNVAEGNADTSKPDIEEARETVPIQQERVQSISHPAVTCAYIGAPPRSVSRRQQKGSDASEPQRPISMSISSRGFAQQHVTASSSTLRDARNIEQDDDHVAHENTQAPVKRARGRPRGSKNKPSLSLPTAIETQPQAQNGQVIRYMSELRQARLREMREEEKEIESISAPLPKQPSMPFGTISVATVSSMDAPVKRKGRPQGSLNKPGTQHGDGSTELTVLGKRQREDDALITPSASGWHIDFDNMSWKRVTSGTNSSEPMPSATPQSISKPAPVSQPALQPVSIHQPYVPQIMSSKSVLAPNSSFKPAAVKPKLKSSAAMQATSTSSPPIPSASSYIPTPQSSVVSTSSRQTKPMSEPEAEQAECSEYQTCEDLCNALACILSKQSALSVPGTLRSNARVVQESGMHIKVEDSMLTRIGAERRIVARVPYKFSSHGASGDAQRPCSGQMSVSIVEEDAPGMLKGLAKGMRMSVELAH
ncbi:hypothetical protein A0H81_07157 [Grifola frondosa]|uniref:Uncharacterized protein n=1 Tax=Grifola frondosa TaxID=5627 RepID=A0A1C7M8V8_GRIFR|nr:hypothetical protein A0H81_07157 [Grifola frondosa]